MATLVAHANLKVDQAFGYNIYDLDLQEILGQPGDPWDTIMQNTTAGLGEPMPAKSVARDGGGDCCLWRYACTRVFAYIISRDP